MSRKRQAEASSAKVSKRTKVSPCKIWISREQDAKQIRSLTETKMQEMCKPSFFEFDEALQKLQKGDKSVGLLVAKDGSKRVGFLLYQLHTGPEVLFGNVETGKTVRYSDKVVNLYIHAVCVHPQYRKNRIGRCLIDSAQDVLVTAAEDRHSRVALITLTSANPDLNKYYRSLGFFHGGDIAPNLRPLVKLTAAEIKKKKAYKLKDNDLRTTVDVLANNFIHSPNLLKNPLNLRCG